MNRKAIAIFAAALLLGIAAHAQDDKMHTDWPDQSEDVKVMKPGQVQFETGMIYNSFDKGKNAFIAHELIRFGVVKKLELRMLVEDGRQRDRYIEETSQSVYPISLSAKYSLLEDHDWLPDVTVVGYVKLPFTSRSSSQTAYWSPAFIAAFEQELTKKLKLEYNAGIRQNAYDKEYAWIGTAGLLYDLSPKLEVFAEYFAQYQPEEAPQHNIDAGLLYDIGRNMQLDLAAGSTIFYEEPNRFLSLGFCYRVGR
jgi:Putative MetA-pathway of phenol degradation